VPDNPKWLLQNEHAISGKKIIFPDDATQYLDGTGVFTVPAGGGSGSAGEILAWLGF
jgi:hypothetical protein